MMSFFSALEAGQASRSLGLKIPGGFFFQAGCRSSASPLSLISVEGPDHMCCTAGSNPRDGPAPCRGCRS